MSPANLGAVRRLLLTSAVLASFAVDATAQVVEKGRTFADLTATHPCSSAYLDRIARVTDCDAADDIGDGGGAFQCWATCDGSAPWEAVAIGGGGGLPGAGEVTEAMLKAVDTPNDEEYLTYEVTTGDFEWQAAATGDVVGPASSTANKFPLWSGTTGKLLQDNSTYGISSGFIIGSGGVSGLVNSLSASFGGMVIGSDAVGTDKGYLSFYTNGTAGIVGLEYRAASDYRLGLQATAGICWVSSGVANDTENCDSGLLRAATGVVVVTNGTPSGMGWVYQDGIKALNSDFTSTSATPANLTGLTVTLKAGRKYTYTMKLSLSDSVAGEGLLIDFDGGTATATDFTARCKVHDTALLLATTTTALATDVAVATATGASDVECFGDFEVNAAGTFVPRAAQNSHSSGTLTVDRGSFLHVVDTSFN